MNRLCSYLTISMVGTAIVLTTGCANNTIPPEALTLSADTLERRTRQSRLFDTNDENQMLSASAGVLQDLGFTLDESETELGVIVASKDRDATESGQVVGKVILAVLLGVNVAIDDEQKIRASLVTRVSQQDQRRTHVRVTFQRIVWNDQGIVSKIEAIDDPEIYQDFYSRLSKSIFLEAHKI